MCADENIRYEEDNKATTNRNKVREDNFKFDRKFIATVNEEDLQSNVIKNMKTSSQCGVQVKEGRQPAVQISKEDILDEKTAAQDSFAAVHVPSGTTTTTTTSTTICRCVLWQSIWNGEK